jgi:hypothetical protein
MNGAISDKTEPKFKNRSNEQNERKKMKKVFLTIVGFMIFVAFQTHAGSFGYGGQTTCSGDLNGIPVSVTIIWGEVTENAGNFPPYSIHQEQQATVSIALNGTNITEEVMFQQTGGTTRCEVWDRTSTLLFLNQTEPIANLEFVSSWTHTGCRSKPSGVFLTTLQQARISELKCQ